MYRARVICSLVAPSYLHTALADRLQGLLGDLIMSSGEPGVCRASLDTALGTCSAAERQARVKPDPDPKSNRLRAR